MRMKKCKIPCNYISDYIDDLRSGKIKASPEMLQACDYIEETLDDPRVFIDIGKIEKAIEGLKVELGGEYKAVKKLNTLQSYLSSGLERYQDIVEVPEAPEGVEYRNMGTQESQIFSKLKKRFCS